MGKLKIFEAGRQLGEVERDGFTWSKPSHQARLGRRGANELIALLGDGYGDRQFEIVDGATRLSGCTIDAQGGPGDGCTIGFLSASP